MSSNLVYIPNAKVMGKLTEMLILKMVQGVQIKRPSLRQPVANSNELPVESFLQ